VKKRIGILTGGGDVPGLNSVIKSANTATPTHTATARRRASPSLADEIKRRTGEETMTSDLTYDLRSGDPDFVDKLVGLTFGNMAYDAMLEGQTGVMSALVKGCYELVPIPDPKLGPRKLDVATMYNTERYRPMYANKRGLPVFLQRAS
jgi:ATP-dependent phosphofructokinase / diphosphate-dependent phosphofructokinase